jgi:DNA helicase IV
MVEFRGLEARAVILIDLGTTAEDRDFERNLYLGMTRASAVLHVFTPETVKSKMVSLLGRN